MENTSTSVVVKLEIGHQASVRSEKTPEGFTHDWTVFVRGPEGINIHHFVEKVIFYLHESFHKPKRVVKEPPYHVSESGYAGFILPIEVYFKNKEEPKKVRFEYDLYLRMDGPPVNNFRCEKLTFQNPVDDFRRKLVKAGGIGSLVSSDNTGNASTVQTHSTTLGQDKGDHSSDSQKSAVTKVSSFRSQEKKKHSSSKEATKNSSSASRVSKPFNAIFGEPIKTKQSPDQAVKQKEGTAVSSQKVASAHTKPNKIPTSSHPSSNLSHSTKENKVSKAGKEKSPHEKESKDSKHTKSSKYPEKESKQPSLKRQSSPHSQHGSDKKRKRTTSSSSESNPSSQPERKEASRSKHKESKVKEKHKPKFPTTTNTDNATSNSKKERSKDKISRHPKKSSSENSVISPLRHGSQRTSDAHTDGNSAQAVQPDDKIDASVAENKEDSVTHIDDLNSSPSSSISLSSLQPGGSDGPLATMMAEMEKDLLSPLSSDPGSHSLSNSPVLKEKFEDNHTPDGDINMSQSSVMEGASRLTEEEPIEKIDEPENSDKAKRESAEQGTKPRKDQNMLTKKKRDEIDGRVLEETTSKSSVKREKPVDTKNPDEMDKKKYSQVDQAYVNELIDLQQKIMSLRDRRILQKIVDVIEETGNYDVTNSSFDFDLCRLDQMTVRKLQNCLTVK